MKTNPMNSTKKSHDNRSTIQSSNITINKVNQIIYNKIDTQKKQQNQPNKKTKSNKTKRHKH
jgi:hypothetical protein